MHSWGLNAATSAPILRERRGPLVISGASWAVDTTGVEIRTSVLVANSPWVLFIWGSPRGGFSANSSSKHLSRPQPDLMGKPRTEISASEPYLRLETKSPGPVDWPGYIRREPRRLGRSLGTALIRRQCKELAQANRLVLKALASKSHAKASSLKTNWFVAMRRCPFAYSARLSRSMLTLIKTPPVCRRKGL